MLYLLAVLIPLVCGALLPFLKIRKKGIAHLFIFTALGLTLLTAVGGMLSQKPFTLLQFSRGLTLTYYADGLGCFFALLFLVIWILTAVYTTLYITHEGNENRFFAFLLMTLGGMLGVAFSQNPVTLYLHFELATLFSMPLVLHSRSAESVSAALKYLFYSIGGAFMGLLGIFALYFYSEDATFRAGGTVNPEALGQDRGIFLVLIFLAILGFSTKAGMFPMHAWLPTAHPVAPASASALLSGVITKAGVVAVIRILYYSVGTELLAGTWVQRALLILALITVFTGSMMAYREPLLKKRLAYSTVSNLSYILVGLFTLCPRGLTGALLHVIAHATAKTALFLIAGAIIYQTGKTRVGELTGIGKEIPIAMWGFTLASLSLIGIPPFSGFVSKWYLAAAALEGVGSILGVMIPVILLLSALLTAGYLLSIVVAAFFPGKNYDYTRPKTEAAAVMTLPILLLSLSTLLCGLLASPLIDCLGSILG